MAIRIGIVVAAHPEDHSIDVIMTDDFSRIAGVQVLTSNGGIASGTADMFVPDEKTGDDKWNMAKRTGADQKVAIDFSGPMPVVVGFFYPQVGQMTFADKNRRIQRHTSDVYSTVDSAGNFELRFPNGTFIRIGATPDHEDLTGKDFDKKWAIKKNKTAATHLRLVLGNAGVVKADMHIDPSGNVTGSFAGTGDLTFAGNVALHAPQVTLDTPQLIVTGHITVGNGITSTGDVTADGISLKTHVHGGITPGPSDTAAPH